MSVFLETVLRLKWLAKSVLLLQGYMPINYNFYAIIHHGKIYFTDIYMYYLSVCLLLLFYYSIKSVSYISRIQQFNKTKISTRFSCCNIMGSTLYHIHQIYLRWMARLKPLCTNFSKYCLLVKLIERASHMRSIYMG